MIKRITFLLALSMMIFSLAACATTGTPASGTPVPSNVPPTVQVVSPTPPPQSPTATPTTILPTPTGPVIQHWPSGQEFTVTDIHMVDATNGWGIGGVGNVGDHVLFTTDGGSTWKDLTPPQVVAPSGVQQSAIGFFQDARTAWVVYTVSGGNPVPSESVVWHTSDGGATWIASQPLDITGLSEIFVPSDLQFVNGQAGWLLVHVGVGMNHDYVVLYRSTDSGASWSRILDPYNDGGIQSCVKSAMLFTDATHGWLTGDCGGVKAGVLLFNTTDAGSTWQAVTLPDPSGAQGYFENQNIACGSYDPFFFGNDLGHLSIRCMDYSSTLVKSASYIYTTQNGGSTWTGASYPGTSLYFFSADTGWAIAPKIQLTRDGGTTWKAIADVTWTPKLDFISEQIGWAIALANDQIALVKSDNGGALWTILTPTVGP